MRLTGPIAAGYVTMPIVAEGDALKKTLLTVLISAAAIVAGCKNKHAEPGGPVLTLPADTFKAQWTRDLNIQPKELHLIGNDLFVFTSKNVLYRLDARGGSVGFVSDYAPAGAHVQAPVLTKDAVIIPADTKLLMLDQKGYRKGEIDLDYPIRSGAIGTNTGIYVGIDTDKNGGRLAAVDLDRPASPIRWELMTGGAVISTPATYQGIIYVASDDGKVYAVGPDREAMWGIQTFQTDRAIRAGLAVDATGVYAASLDGKLYVLDKDTGKLLWEYYAGTFLADTPVITQDLVFLTVRDQGVIALDKKSGAYIRKALWSLPEARGYLSENANLVMLRGENNRILAVDKKTGVIKFHSNRDDLKFFAQNLSMDGVVYCSTSKGLIIAAVPVSKPGQVGQLVFSSPADAPSLLAVR